MAALVRPLRRLPAKLDMLGAELVDAVDQLEEELRRQTEGPSGKEGAPGRRHTPGNGTLGLVPGLLTSHWAAVAFIGLCLLSAVLDLL
ncbi:hypothetical protein CC117_28980 [Parafrankia colletiae]|uniref:Uncharacterized protein n=1 Tax=Parafrankia colletiae TaxID=573497 RepID=A0A1S1Q7N4_9ACTN|nr:hypothetical protein [Parafrankia colletiae]OHV29599.1 hypothetical protein CC117_28980 [Parafrankia colletiae]